MSLSSYLFLGLILIVAFFILFNKYKYKEKVAKRSIEIILLFSLLFVGLSYYTFRSLTHSSDLNMYKNTDLAHLELTGYRFKELVNLFNSNNAETALFDQEKGYLSVIKEDSAKYALSYRHLSKPLYIQNNSGEYVLQTDGALPIDNTINIKIRRSTDTVYNYLQIRYNDTIIKKDYSLVDIIMQKAQEKLKVQFTIDYLDNNGNTIIENAKSELLTFRYGLPLLEILAICDKKIPLTEEQNELLNDTYIVREIYGNKTSQLYFLPGHNLSVAHSAGYGTSQNSLRSGDDLHTVSLPVNKEFFLGIGYNQTPKWKVKQGDDNWSVLEYKLKPKYPFFTNDTITSRPTVSKMYLSTDLNEIIRNSSYYDGVISFGNLKENNINHIDASLRFANEDINTAYKFKLADNFQSPDSIPKNNGYVSVNNPIELNTSGNHNLKYLVEISVPIMQHPINHYPWLMFGLIFLYLVLLAIFKRREEYKGKNNEAIQISYFVESLVMWVLLAYLTVRLIVYWRLIAFPPLKDISYNEYIKIVDQNRLIFSEYPKYYLLISGIALLFLRFLIFPKLKNTKPNSAKRNEFNWPGYFKDIGLYILFLGSFLFGLEFVNHYVFIKILLPFVFFFSVQRRFFLSGKTQLKYLLLPLAFFLVFLVFDKGFIPLLLVFLVLYYSAIYFFYNPKDDNNNGYLVRYLNISGYPVRYLEFFAVLIIFIFLLFPFKPIRSGAASFLHRGGANRIAYRFKILDYDVGEILSETAYNSDNAEKVGWAASSFWFAKNYLYKQYYNNKIHKDTTKNVKKGNVEVRKLPAFFDTFYPTRAGVSIINQTRDLVLVRYIIYEHGKWVPFLLIAYLILLLFVYYYYTYDADYSYLDKDKNVYADKIRHKSYNLIFVGIVLLLISINLIIYLVNMNQYPFLGQDFLFLTMTGSSALFSGFFIFMALVLLINENNFDVDTNRNAKFVQVVSNWISDKGKIYKESFPISTSLVLSIVLGVILFVYPANLSKQMADLYSNDNGTHENLDYIVRKPIEALRNFTAVFNKPFTAYQRDLINGSVNKEEFYIPKDYIEKVVAGVVKDTTYSDNVQNIKGNRIVVSDFTDVLKPFYNNYFINKKANNDSINYSINDSIYVKTAFEDFAKQKNMQTFKHVLFLRKNRNGVYSLGVNRRYYTIAAIFDKEEKENWSGNLLANTFVKDIVVQNLRNRQKFGFASSSSLPSLPSWAENIDYSKSLKDYFDIYKIDGAVFGKEKPVLIAKINSNIKGVLNLKLRTVNDGENNGIKETENLEDIILKPGDVISVSAERVNRQMRIDLHKGEYLARKYHYNGDKRYFYPLGKDFVWAYAAVNHFINYGHDGLKSKKSDIETSIDYDLQQEILRDITPRNNAYVTVADARGRVWAMVDRNRDKMDYRIDPNNPVDFTKKTTKTFFGNAPFKEEDVFGTRNLRIYKYGFGSTIKPIIYSAVTSQLPVHWEHIIVNNEKEQQSYEVGDNKYIKGHKFFGGRELNSVWSEFYADDEFKRNHNMDNREYLVKSRNMYNAVIVALGTFPKSRFNRNDRYDITNVLINNAALNRIPTQDNERNRYRFPRLRINGHYYYFDLVSRGYNNYQGILDDGLYENYNFVTSKDKVNDKQQFEIKNYYQSFKNFNLDSDLEKNKGIGIGYRLFYPERLRFIRYDDNDFYSNVINPAKSGNPFELTQYGMVESILKLFTFNKDFKLGFIKDSLINSQVLTTTNWNKEEWQNNRFENFVQNNIFRYMNQSSGVFTINNIRLRGTSAGLLEKINNDNDIRVVRQNNRVHIVYNRQNYYVYAKTGTSNGRNGKNDKSQFFIISNKDLTVRNAYTESDKPKIVAIHIFLAQSDDEGTDIKKSVITSVIKSQSMKEYFGNN